MDRQGCKQATALFHVLIIALVLLHPSRSFSPCTQKRHPSANTPVLTMSDDWGSFQALDDDYDVEDDTQEQKAAVGASVPPPDIAWDADPIQVPPGSQLELTEETVLGVLSACRFELGTLFGYSAENRGVGITGGVDYVEMDGPTVVIALKGRFWHQRTTVLDRVTNYLQQRIPEIVDVMVEDPWQLTDEANEVF